MIRKASDVLIARFHEDRNLLIHNYTEIAKKMGMEKSNYSNYVNGRNTITNQFLKKFYAAFGEEINEIRSQLATGERGIDYLKIEDRDKRIVELEKKVKEFERKYEQLLESHQKISSDIRSMETKIDRVLEERLDRIERLLARLVEKILAPANGKPDKPTQPAKSTKPAKPSTRQKKAPEDLQGS